MLCEYFRQFGAIERVQILPERLKFTDILPAIGTTGFIDQPPANRKYFAYVTFVNCLGAYDALNKDTHEIQNQKLCVEQAFSWHQPNSEIMSVIEAKAKKNDLTALNKVIFSEMDKSLNDDCIIKIMSFLDVYELGAMAKYSQRFQLLAQHQRNLKITQKESNCGAVEPMTIMELRNLLRLQGFGHSAISLKISISAFQTSQRHAICDRLVQYLGPQLKSLSLIGFGVTSSHFEQFKPLLLQLHYLDIDLSYEFDYEKLHEKWLNLRELRIKSVGSVQLLSTTSTKIAKFPNVTNLVIASGYKLHENLFKTIASNFSNVRQLAIVIIYDYYTELSNASAVNDFQHIHELKQLKKLHLSFNRTYLTDNVIDTIAKMNTLENFTLEINNYGVTGERWFDITMRNLKKLLQGMVQAKELRLSGILLTFDKLSEIIRTAISLEMLCIHNCNFTLSLQFWESVVALLVEKKMKWGKVHNCGVLTLTVDAFVDFAVSEVSV